MIYNYLLNFIIYFLFILLLSCNSENKTSWEKIEVDGIENYLVNAVDFHDEEAGLIVANLRGRSKIFKTNDGGRTWEQMFELNQGLHDVMFVNSARVIAAGNEGLWLSVDSGESWDAVDLRTSDPLIAVDFGSDQIGLAAGMNGTILKTDDGGESWVKQESGSSSFLRDIVFIDLETAFVVGFDGTILKTVNGGQKWETVTTDYTGNLSAVGFVDTERVFTVGASGTILQTNDGGATWTNHDTGIDNGLLGIDFYENSGIITGFGGTIIKSDDAGSRWEIENSGNYPHLYDFAIISSENVLLVGDEGTILKN